MVSWTETSHIKPVNLGVC